MRKTAAAAVLAFAALLTGWTSQAGACVGADRPPNGQPTDAARLAVTCLINHRRAHHHVRRVRGSISLGMAAQGHSNDMAAYNFFSHEGDGTPASRASAAGYMSGAATWGLGEDLEWGSGRLGTPRAIVAGWMASPEHRVILLSRKYRQVGIGVVQGSPVGPDDPRSVVYTALFGFRKG
jgi:uncharacterized protein YkwD